MRSLMEKQPGASRVFDSPVGWLRARVHNGSLVELSFCKQRSIEFADDGTRDDAAVVNAVEAQISEYFAARRTRFDVPLDLRGPEFHRRVWAALLEIPYGMTMSYGQLAAKLGAPETARAVGTANGANPIAIIVPCHRAIGADGSLVGYGGGLRRKQLLLDLEAGRVTLELS